MGRVMNIRWITAALGVLVLAAVCVALGRWQLHRLDERKARNEVTRSNLAAQPAPLDQIVGPQGVVGDQHAWRTAIVSGHYDASKQVILKYRNVEDKPGFEIVTPLMLPDGKAVLVDRGFIARQSSELMPLNVPAVPSGEVTVTGRLQRSERGGHTTGGTPDDGTARLINGPDFAKVLGLNLYDGYVQITKQDPANDPAFGGFPGPEIDDGPHFFYALQWFFFALLAIGGLVYFTKTGGRSGKSRDDTGDGSADSSEDVEQPAAHAGAPD
ncbi:SURF1 family protein [Kribbella sp. NPDC059898]|uniref:SURF1 family cytochrome oxidase biogenesis protein n=1 Tax=Kribbella sp. NPDC059898 TaxID=3346995 RepID=UPI0036600A16